MDRKTIEEIAAKTAAYAVAMGNKSGHGLAVIKAEAEQILKDRFSGGLLQLIADKVCKEERVPSEWVFEDTDAYHAAARAISAKLPDAEKCKPGLQLSKWLFDWATNKMADQSAEAKPATKSRFIELNTTRGPIHIIPEDIRFIMPYGAKGDEGASVWRGSSTESMTVVKESPAEVRAIIAAHEAEA